VIDIEGVCVVPGFGVCRSGFAVEQHTESSQRLESSPAALIWYVLFY